MYYQLSSQCEQEYLLCFALNMKSYQAQKGFTLIELLLYVGLSSVLLISISVFMASLVESRVKNQTIAEVEQQGLQAMQIITQIARNAEAITSPTIGSSGSSITLDVITGANDPTIFDTSGGVLRIKEGSGSPVELTNSRVTVSGLLFSNLSRASTPGIVRIQFTLSYVNNLGRNEFDYSKTFISSASLRHP